MSSLFDSWDTFAAYQELYPVQSPLYDGDISPHSVMNAAPSQSIPPWDESTREFCITLYRHPVTTAFLQDSYKEAKKAHGAIRTVAVYVMRGFADAQSIQVLRSMGFIKSDARGTSSGVCYVKDVTKQEPKPKTEPKVEPLEPKGWAKEFEAVQVRMEHKRLTGALTEADTEEVRWYEEQIEREEAARSTQDSIALDAQIADIERQIQRLRSKLCS